MHMHVGMLDRICHASTYPVCVDAIPVKCQHRVRICLPAAMPMPNLHLCMLQYDVELVHQIEKLIGHDLEAYDVKEGEVLKGISRVFKAHRRAAMQAAEHEQADERKGITHARKKQTATR